MKATSEGRVEFSGVSARLKPPFFAPYAERSPSFKKKERRRYCATMLPALKNYGMESIETAYVF